MNHFLRADGDPRFKSRIVTLLEEDRAAWCGMVRLELWNGVRSEKDRRDLEGLESFVLELPLNDSVWSKAMKLAREARRRGKTCPATDVLISSCAKFHGLEILHDDAHLDTLRDIHV
jgi:predicted nucleic acid-binding protein